MSVILIETSWQQALPDIASDSVNLIIIDPPYLVTSEVWDQMEQVNSELSSELFRVAKDTASLYVWCGIGEKSSSLLRWFPIFDKDWYFKDLITWKKQRGIGMRKGWLYTREEIMWFVKDNKRFSWNKRNQYDLTDKRLFSMPNNLSDYKRWTNVWTDIKEEAGANKSNQYHLCGKPVKAAERIIEAHTQEGDTVLDCFVGGGSTGVAAHNLKRHFIGIDNGKCENGRLPNLLGKTWCEITRERIGV